MQKIFHYFIEVLGWLQIIASPLLAGLAIGTIVYATNPGKTGLIIGASITLIGLIVGMLWATKIWRTEGTNWFISRVMASPDLINLQEDIKKGNSKKNEGNS